MRVAISVTSMRVGKLTSEAKQHLFVRLADNKTNTTQQEHAPTRSAKLQVVSGVKMSANKRK